MIDHSSKEPDAAAGWRWRSGARPGGFALVVAAAALGGCISVKAPDKPIVIELNLNIKQEVVYRLANDAGNTIRQNPEVF
jgi:hypothetical protein